MFDSEINNSCFYKIAMKILKMSGHIDCTEPLFTNHTPEQFLYIDNQSTVAFSNSQRMLIKSMKNISNLCALNDSVFEQKTERSIDFYSIELVCRSSLRSQIANEIHTLIDQIDVCDATVIIFFHNGSILISMSGFGEGVIISDWYLAETEMELLCDKISIVNISLRTAKSYFYDLIYSIARDYYIYPISRDEAMLSFFPINYFQESDLELINREDLEESIENALNYYLHIYGDDYVDPSIISKSNSRSDIGTELDLMLLEMDDSDELLNEEMEKELNELTSNDSEIEYEDYQYENISPEAFEDPSVMVKLLEKGI